MSLWGKTDSAANKPKFLSSSEKANTYGVDTTETGVTAGVTHAGWVKTIFGQGPVANVTVDAAGSSGWANGDQLSVSGGADQDAVGGAVLVVTTNASGNVASVAVSNGGLYTSAPTLGNTGLAGRTGGTFTAVMGGRVGRTQRETLVAMSSITGDAADDALYPDS